MRSGTGGWTMGCNCDPGRPAPPICEVSGAGLPYKTRSRQHRRTNASLPRIAYSRPQRCSDEQLQV